MESRYDEAIGLYHEAFEEETLLEVKSYILAQLAESYRLAERDGFVDWLNEDVRPGLEKGNPLHAVTLELENLFLVRSSQYEKAIANLHALRGDASPCLNRSYLPLPLHLHHPHRQADAQVERT